MIGPRASEAAIRFEGLTKRYGVFTAVDGVDLEVAQGELFGFLGPNGAGKTTSIRMLVGSLRPSAGRVLVHGKDVVLEAMEAKRRVGYIPDRPFLYDKLTGVEFLRFVAGLWGLEGELIDARSAELLDLFGLTRWADTLIESYSHGMRQKLLISSALVHSPEVIVVDEPMVGLDPKGARLIKDLLRAFTEQGGTVFMSTHTLEVAEALCDRIAILEGGRVRAVGTMTELRAASSAGGAGLEEVFLRLTGGTDVADVVGALREAGQPAAPSAGGER
ncbi:MAG: ABC transporter ATP-binding protein [Gemmatimonadota bacterium]